MKNSFFRQIIFFVLFISFVSFNSCTKKEVVEEIPVQKWTPVEKHIALLFGYGYNDKAFVDSICSKLAEEYGLEKENGLILPLIYPDDFLVTGSIARISNLSSIVKDKNCRALITLGAPEYTHRALAKIQDENLNCTVISLFSQDDILGTEAGSFLVFDFAEDELVLSDETEDESITEFEEEAITSLTNDTELKHLDKMNFLVSKVVESLKNPLEIKNKEILQVATGIFGKNWEVSSFLDTDTGLRAKNHFVLNYVEPVVVEEPEDEKAKAKSFFERLGIK
ncbi:MAG: DUF3798 domain-containing protein [Spirochaetaceae bacterium]|nr:DUF3798 domain-containing protein [Spirochaetaceae bacterium]